MKSTMSMLHIVVGNALASALVIFVGCGSEGAPTGEGGAGGQDVSIGPNSGGFGGSDAGYLDAGDNGGSAGARDGEADSKEDTDATAGSGGTGPDCPTGFVLISAGTFSMGAPSGEAGSAPDELPRNVTLTNAFCMAETEVTQQQYENVMGWGERPSLFSRCAPDCPVENVTWFDAVRYCNELSTLEELDPCYTCSSTECVPEAASPYECKGYRLPTEAEWEYAARAGTNTAFYNGVISYPGSSPIDPNLDKIGWYVGNSNAKTHKTKQKKPNNWSLFDMSGNVNEWCHDFWSPAGSTSDETDPYGPTDGSARVVRGGGYDDPASACRSADRKHSSYRYYIPTYKNSNLGFRPVKTVHNSANFRPDL